MGLVSTARLRHPFLISIVFAARALAVPLTGLVEDPAGHPLAGAAITFEPATMENLFFGTHTGRASAVTGSDGAFHFDTSPQIYGFSNWAGLTGSVRVSAPGWGATDAPVFLAGQNRVTMEPAFTARGLVTTEAGIPLSRIKIHYLAGRMFQHPMLAVNDDLADLETISGADGSWALPGLPRESPAYVEINDPRFVAVEELASDKTSVRLVARPAVTIRGRVITPEGQPVAGLWISCPNFQVGSASPQVLTSADGTYALTGLPWNGHTLILTDPSDKWIAPNLYLPNSIEGATLTAPDWKVESGIPVTARFLDRDTRAPLSGCCLLLTGRQTALSLANVVSGEEGRITLHCLADGEELDGLILRNGYLGASRTVTIAPRTASLDLGDIPLTRGVTVTGSATTANGLPARGAVLLSIEPTGELVAIAEADDKGQFSLRPVTPQSPYAIGPDNGMLWADPPQPPGTTPALGRAAPPVHLVLTPADLVPVAGRVVDGAGDPIAGASVLVMIQDRMGQFSFRSAVTGDDGAYSVPVSPRPQQASVKLISADGRRAVTLGVLVPDPGDGPLNLLQAGIHFSDSVLVKMGGHVSGQVVNAAGNPVAGALLATAPQVAGETANPNSYPRTGPDGRFELDGLPEVSLHVLAAKDRLYGETVAKSGSTVRIQLQAPQDIDASTRDHYLAGFKDADYDNMFQFWDYLGEDKMLELALRVDGVLALSGTTNPTEAGHGFFVWLEQLAERDPARAGLIGPDLLARYDPRGTMEEPRQEVAVACAYHGDARGRKFANDWIDAQIPIATAIEPDVDQAGSLFRLAALAMVLKRPDAEQLFELGVTTAKREMNSPLGDFGLQWGTNLSVGGEASLHRLDGRLPPWILYQVWSESISNLAREDLPAARRAVERTRQMRQDPAVIAYMKDPKHDPENLFPGNMVTVLQALSSAECRDGSPEALELETHDGQSEVDYDTLANAAIVKHDFATARSAILAGADREPAYCAGLAGTFDPDLSRDLFSQAANPYPDYGPEAASKTVDPAYAFYHGFIDPASSRLSLESWWIDLHQPGAPPPDPHRPPDPRTQIAAALFAFDQTRSLTYMKGTPDAAQDPSSLKYAIAAMMESDWARWALLPP